MDGHEPRQERRPKAVERIEASILQLSSIDVPVIATTGNHDNWYGGDRVEALLGAAGVTVVDNDALVWGEFCIVGFADQDTDRPTADGYELCDDGQPIIALMHSPDSRGLMTGDEVLAVAGHTHGGQINLPFIGRRVTSTQCGEPCAYGMIQSGPPLYVTSGLGTSILPLRFRSPPELVVFTLNY